MKPVVHAQAICESKAVGEGTRIWAFAHVLSGAQIGADCNICDHVFIENDVKLGDRVTVKCGVQLWDGVELEDDVFVGPNVTFTNDSFPRSKQYPEKFAKTLVKRGASIGANATLLPGLTIGARAMIGAGAVVTKDVPPLAIVKGNPGRISGYVDTTMAATVGARRIEPSAITEVLPTRVRGVRICSLPVHTDMRGDLTASEFEKDLPFSPRRYFIVFNVPSEKVRGEHAHRECHQFLVCVRGSCHVIADDGTHREEFVLDHPGIGIHLPPHIWVTQYRYSSDAVVLVFASLAYDAQDYVRDYDDFKRLVEADGPER
jgi:UDP-2-acetamido-3-amino-2,3-dideoxy-glucuronate N-acetyltransferase